MRIDRNISLVFNLALLIMASFLATSVHAQQSGSASSSGLNSPVNYQANDSIVADIPNQLVRLYGEAKVEFEDVILNAELIEIDLKKNEVIATYGLDSTGNPFGKPVFSSAGEESQCEYIKYNFETKKGFVKEVRMQQGEGYIHMAESKVHPNEQIHFKNGKFTTCDKEEPHFHFKLSRAIVVPDKRIVTGPVYMEILRVPTPLAAPFGFFPNSETKKAGIILPEFQSSGNYGFGLENLGYYIPLGEYWETYFYGSIFTSGSWAAENRTNYYRKYKFRGGFGLRFEQFRGRFYETYDLINKWTVNWNHTQDAKAHPTLKFSTNINFVSDNTGQTSLDAINPGYFNNTFNSSINVTKSWRTNRFSGTMGLKTSLQQNSQSGNYSLELPQYNLSVSRFNLGVLRSSPISTKWYQKTLDNINITYSMNARNFIQAPDSIFNFNDLNQVGSYAKNGVEHRTTVQSNLRLFGGRMVFTPSAVYREYWNFQYEEREWNASDEKVDTTEFNQFRASRDITLNGSLNTNFFGYYKMKGKQQMKFRHVASPNISFSYRPDIGLYQQIQTDTNGTLSYYSPFSQSLYREGGQGESGAINFGLNNTLEMKKRAMSDTINETFKAYKLIDAFSINGNYDFLKDSMNLGNFALAFRTTKFFNVFSFQSNASLSPYSWDESTGETFSEYAWNANQGVGRFRTAKGVLNANFTNQRGRDKQKENAEKAKDNANATSTVTDPSFRDFEIPWVLNLSYNIDYTRTSSKNALGVTIDTFNLIQTIRADGNFNFNEKWKLDYLVNFDFLDMSVPSFNIGLWRDLHCWETSLFYQQIGPLFPGAPHESNWSILFKIGVKASMFQDIKYDHTFRRSALPF